MEGWVDLVTRKRSRRESNSWPIGPESNALTTEPPSNNNYKYTLLLYLNAKYVDAIGPNNVT